MRCISAFHSAKRSNSVVRLKSIYNKILTEIQTKRPCHSLAVSMAPCTSRRLPQHSFSVCRATFSAIDRLRFRLACLKLLLIAVVVLIRNLSLLLALLCWCFLYSSWLAHCLLPGRLLTPLCFLSRLFRQLGPLLGSLFDLSPVLRCNILIQGGC